MVEAWYIDDEMNDLLDKDKNTKQFVSKEQLYEKTGANFFKLNMGTLEADGVLEKIKREYNYTHEDELADWKECLPDEAKQKAFFAEHLHTDVEIRLVMEGLGYLDVRDKSDQWIRIQLSAGAMFILPSGIYHRFAHDSAKNYIKVKRIFPEDKKFATYNRPADEMPCRKEYVDKLAKGFVAPANSGSCSY